MRNVRSTIATKLFVVATLVLFMVAQHPGALSSAEAVKATTALKHKPIKYFVPGHRIQVEAKVTDPQGVSLVRCYFRAAGQADYVFVGMKAGDSSTFMGTLPAPAAETKSIEYLFLAVNGKNQVVKTQEFRTELKALADVPDWQKSGGEGQLAVSSELAGAAAPKGFVDSIGFDVVESSVRFGFVAGIYAGTRGAVGGGAAGASEATPAAGSAAGAAGTASSAGTVVASSGISTTAVVSASVAAIAVGAGVVIASDGNGGGDTSDAGSGGNDSATAGCEQYAGNWAGTINGTDCQGSSGSNALTMTVASDCSASMCMTECDSFQVVGDSISFQAADDTGPITVQGTFTSPATANGTWSSSCGGGGTWSYTKQ